MRLLSPFQPPQAPEIPLYVVLRLKNPVAVCISPKARKAYLTVADHAGAERDWVGFLSYVAPDLLHFHFGSAKPPHRSEGFQALLAREGQGGNN